MTIKQLIALSSAIAIILSAGCDTSDGINESSRGSGNAGGGSQAPDPVVVDFPIAFVERPIPMDEDGNFVPDDVMDPVAFNPGARLIIKDRASVPANETVITEGVFPPVDDMNPDTVDTEEPLYDVKDVETSSDGTKLIFAMRAPEIPDADDDEQPTWNIWEYDRETGELRRVITSDLIAEEGHDISPHYLPDGRIVFSSTRQRRSKAILLDENKPQFTALNEDRDEEAFVLHVMDEDGTDIEQITFNQSHDLQPTVLSSGEILFLRWDNYANNRDRLSLYKVNPDGTNASIHYGYHSQTTGTNGTEGAFVQPREMPDGRILVSLRQRSTLRLGGDMVVIDAQNFTDINQPVGTDTGTTESAQQSLALGPVFTDGAFASPHGYFNSTYPLDDNTDRLLVSWSPCVIQGYKLGIYINQNLELIGGEGQYVDTDGNDLNDIDPPVVITPEEVGIFPCTDETIALPEVPEADPLYGLWIYDPLLATQSPVIIAEPGLMFSDAIVLEPKTPPEHRPAPITGTDISQELVDQSVGVVHIHSVYDVDGTDISPSGISATADPAQTPASLRPARFIRIIKAVSIPDDDVFDFDFGSAAGAGNVPFKDILGYVPVEPDGSAMFKVPADVAFTISILDARGKRISPRHQNWMTVRAGEVRQCKGCHNQQSAVPHGRADAELASINNGALSPAPFVNTRLLDAFDTPQPPPEVGETMAAYYARVHGSTTFPEEGARTPSMNIVFEDEWTDDTGGLTREADFDYSYSNLASGAAPVTNAGCLSSWNSLCRAVINYVDHIQPIWEAPRQIFDPNDPMLLLADNTCTSCHASVNAMGVQIVPAGSRQLDLSGGPSDVNVDYINSYPELFNADDFLELNENGILQPEQIQLVVDDEPQYEALDIDGNPVTSPLIPPPDVTLVLDMDNQPIPVMVPSGRQVQGVLSPNGARASQNFFNVFEVGGGTVDHRSFLNSAELKLIAEWLDIGGQYYNNPFDAPPN